MNVKMSLMKMVLVLGVIFFVLSGCSMMRQKPDSKTSTFPKGKGVFLAYSSSYEEGTALDGAKWEAEKECKDKHVITEDVKSIDQRKDKQIKSDTGKVADGILGMVNKNKNYDNFKVELLFHCE